MSWPITTSEKETIHAFECYIKANCSMLKKKQLYIFGASVRGTLMGMLLAESNIHEFIYVDNDRKKWGKNICGHKIISLVDLNIVSSIFVLVPLEYPEDVCIQLSSAGLVEHIDYEVISAGQDEVIIDEFFRHYRNKYMFFGETTLNTSILCEKNRTSIKEEFYNRFGKNDLKVFSVNCMGMMGFYYLMKLQVLKEIIPKKVVIFLNYETLTDFHHLLSRSQKYSLMKIIISKCKCIDDVEYAEYLEEARINAMNYMIETRYSPQRVQDEENVKCMSEIRREYARLNLIYNLNIESVEIEYMQKLLNLCLDNKIKPFVAILPHNYEQAKEYGYDAEHVLKANAMKIKDICDEYYSNYIDMTFLLSKEYFEQGVTVADGICEKGRRLIVKFVSDKLLEMGL